MEKYMALDLLFETELRHLYSAEKAIYENLHHLEEKALSIPLKDAFHAHRADTQKQIQRLEQIFNLLDIDFRSSKLQGLPRIADQAKELLKTLLDMNFTDRSKGIDGILKEGIEILRHFEGTDANEFALVNVGQKVEHSEIACYTFLCHLAKIYDMKKVADLLKESLYEEKDMEKFLVGFAKNQLYAPVAMSKK